MALGTAWIQAWLGSVAVPGVQKMELRPGRLPGPSLLPRPVSGPLVAAAWESLQSREAVARRSRVGVVLGPLLRIILMHRPEWNKDSFVLTLSFETGAQCSCVHSAQRVLLHTQADWLIFLVPGPGRCKIRGPHR